LKNLQTALVETPTFLTLILNQKRSKRP